MLDQETIKHISDGKLFTVIFRKRADGSIRKMTCRRGVTAHLKGGVLPYDPMEKDLLTVFDVEKEGYRTVPLDAIIELHHHGKKEYFPDNA